MRRALLFGNVTLFLAAIVAIAVLMAVSRAEARRAEAAALEARNATSTANGKLAEANKLFMQALEAQKEGRSSQAAELQRQAQQFEQQANSGSVLTPSELTELDRLRREESAWVRTEAALRQQLAAQKAGAQPAELDARDQRAAISPISNAFGRPSQSGSSLSNSWPLRRTGPRRRSRPRAR